MTAHIDSYTDENHVFPLHPHGRSLTEDCHAERVTKQRENVQRRINEIMDGDEEPLSLLMQSKLAHRGCGVDEMFDDAIIAVKDAFGHSEKTVRSASADAFLLEQKRRENLKRRAENAAVRRSGSVVAEDHESLVPNSGRGEKEGDNAGPGNA